MADGRIDEEDMRYPPDQKAKARRALLQAGMRSMKAAGFNGVGVDGLAAGAGVTSGAFYSNFANKDEMLEAIVETAVGEPFLSDTETANKAELRREISRFLDEYLTILHVANPSEGCPTAALSVDVGRAGGVDARNVRTQARRLGSPYRGKP
jgi:AcrR family transcriptional regulator